MVLPFLELRFLRIASEQSEKVSDRTSFQGLLDAFSQLYGEADVDAALGILQDLDEVHYCLWEMNWLPEWVNTQNFQNRLRDAGRPI